MQVSNKTREVKVGNVAIGAGAPIRVQSMGNISPYDEAAIVSQILRCAELGCEIFRLTVPDERAATVFGSVRKASPIPIVADIHFDYKCALAAIANGADALRINPGNIGSREKVQAVVSAAKAKKIPIRIGVNLGSLERGLAAKLQRGELTVAAALCQSAFSHVKILEEEGFNDIVISAKASNTLETIEVYRQLSERTDYPLHVGVTEAGTFLPGTVRSSVALGVLLSEGIGDTLRVSLTDKPESEVRVGVEILRSLGLREMGPSITSCPTCGRTRVDLLKISRETEEALEAMYRKSPRKNFPKVAVMGCAVNGPGEAKGADIALCGGKGEFLLFVKGKSVGKVSESEAVRKVLEYAAVL